ncbi:sensor histidine kinase [Nonomuraea rhizosphaerae]|uniref:sensor histidine kinase n=1 Tax=Nonomuraea rhizosphaerae TaxID=2665663 RepID=UPI0027E32DB8|nr:ATP-binding protein [Nonomuraea rhizosphaerae]
MITRFGRSVRARLTLFASAAMALLCVVVSGFVLYAVHNTAMDISSDKALTAAFRLVHLAKRGTLPAVISSDAKWAQVVNVRGRVVAATENVATFGPLTRLEPAEDNANRTQIACDLPHYPGSCQIVAAVRIYQEDGDWLIYAATDVAPWYVHPAVLAFLAGCVLVLVALTWFGVSRVVARTLGPVDRIRTRLAEITATDLGKRVPVPENADEIKALAQTANQTLDRLEGAVERQRRFVSDASHDLRSPITAMRAQVEEAMMHPGDADWPGTGQALLGSMDRLQCIVEDLLALAKLDAGAPAVREPIDLSELVRAETVRPRSKQVITTMWPGVTVMGDRLQLARLLTNLLDNGERHAVSQVVVAVRSHASLAVLEVLDDGAGIAPEHREAIFERFTRLDAARSRDSGGTGLGLSIAREIATAHGGTLTVEESDTGADFVLRLPLKED